MNKKRAITLSEILAATALIGVVAAVCVPSFVSIHHQHQFKTGLKKAVDTISSALSINITKGERSAYYTNSDYPLFYYLQKNLNVLSPLETSLRDSNNSEFSTKDNIRYEFPKGEGGSEEFGGLVIKDKNGNRENWEIKDNMCGTSGLGIGGSLRARAVQPCIILVDVNGDDEPNTLTDDNGGKLNDMFLLIVTDKSVFPYGRTAQKAFYGEDE